VIAASSGTTGVVTATMSAAVPQGARFFSSVMLASSGNSRMSAANEHVKKKKLLKL
jgi:hypothetical protein